MSRNKRSQATASRFYPFKGGLALERGGNRDRSRCSGAKRFPRSQVSKLYHYIAHKSIGMMRFVALMAKPANLFRASVVVVMSMELTTWGLLPTAGASGWFSEPSSQQRVVYNRPCLPVLLFEPMPAISGLLVPPVDPLVVAPLAAGEVAGGGLPLLLDVEVGYGLRAPFGTVLADLVLDLLLWHGRIVPEEGEITKRRI